MLDAPAAAFGFRFGMAAPPGSETRRRRHRASDLGGAPMVRCATQNCVTVYLLFGEANYSGIDTRVRQTLTARIHVLELRERPDAHAVVRHAARITLGHFRFEALERETRALLFGVGGGLVRADLQEIAGVRVARRRRGVVALRRGPRGGGGGARRRARRLRFFHRSRRGKATRAVILRRLRRNGGA